MSTSFVPRKPTTVQPLTARRPTSKAGRLESVSHPLTSREGGDHRHSGLAPAPPKGGEGLSADEYTRYLTSFEHEEVKNYSPILCVGQECTAKIPAPVPAGVNNGYDDERGDYIIKMRDHISYRYEVVSMLGKGSFGQVAKCIDHKTGQHVAVKIIRNKKRFHQQAQIEIKILQHLRDRDVEGKYGIVKLVETFVFRNHVCLSYELLSMNLYEYMKLNKFHPMPLNIVKKIGASLLISLAFMWRENIIHCDLKPENILLRQPNRTGVKVIDLGSACFEDQRLYTYIQSRFYRAPEVILGLPYTKRIDLWSYACVLCELAVGYPLFPGENEVEQLACIMEVMDVPPSYLLDSSTRRSNFFESTNAGYTPKLVANSRKKIRHPRTKNLASVLGVEEDDMFVDFIRMFLRWDPHERPAPEPAMRHPWICDAYVGVTPKMPTVPGTSRGRSSGARRSSASAAAPVRGTTSGGSDRHHESQVPHLPTIPGKVGKK